MKKIWNYKFSGIVSAFFMTISVLILKIVDKVTSSLFILNIDEHGKNIIMHHGFDYRNKPVGKALEIGEYAFIGSKSIIVHNCNYIGKHAVIGSGSVVTKDVPDFAVVAGNPARIIKYINGDGKES